MFFTWLVGIWIGEKMIDNELLQQVANNLKNGECLFLIDLHGEGKVAVSLSLIDCSSRFGDIEIKTIDYHHADDPIPEPSPPGMPEPSFYGRDPIFISWHTAEILDRCFKALRNNGYKFESPRPQNMKFSRELIEQFWYEKLPADSKKIVDEWNKK